MRGDNQFNLLVQGHHHGPSPRAWGQLLWAVIIILMTRTIPTCVGTTSAFFVPFFSKTDHPHVRGDNYHTQAKHMLPHGPSPRAWGQRKTPPSCYVAPRTIPTCVGTTKSSSLRKRASKDHPHVRGDNIRVAQVTKLVVGPSPRAWGQLQMGSAAEKRQRTIPTCVGTTFSGAAGAARPTDHPHVRGDN